MVSGRYGLKLLIGEVRRKLWRGVYRIAMVLLCLHFTAIGSHANEQTTVTKSMKNKNLKHMIPTSKACPTSE